MNKLHSILVVRSCRCSYYDEKLIKKNNQNTVYFYLCAELIEMNLFYLQAVLYQIVFKSIKFKFTFGFCRAVLFSHYKLTRIAIFVLPTFNIKDKDTDWTEHAGLQYILCYHSAPSHPPMLTHPAAHFLGHLFLRLFQLCEEFASQMGQIPTAPSKAQ